ncbi:hypothetical protein [Pseudoteredinibacter isoporae]|uniref:HDOD domain-containing protein n=1 Tax=Pseudoteredinibacter isoporae TaxID=570281 RepID=A0A7X0MV35_9GAMM|nr:hypothetical protein [Pseudoteredinibacter isoporae]MBB6520665.1 hypothetical protein [Pseudoteredinibacter isoporae]NHO86232.1 hypothetical protein [Pseudoteredinibacter isoporae]NIB25317.1 hypothetical protein [Pseudoteredinibacter isoporae]
MSAPVQLVIKPQAAGDRYWLQKLNRLEWKVLPGTRQQVLHACQASTANAANVAAACLNDPLLCWILSQQANTLIPQREKWPNHLEQLISLIGMPKIIRIVQSCNELPREHLTVHYAVLSRSVIHSLLATEIFSGISSALKNDWAKQFQLSSVLFRLPEWAMAIDSPHTQLQLEVLHKQGHNNEQSQQIMLGCTFSELSEDFCRQNAILPACHKAWKWQEMNNFVQLKSTMQAFRRRQEGRPEPQTPDAALLLIACHRLASQLWNARSRQQNLKLLSGASGLSREQLHGIVNHSMLNMPWHDSLSIDLHPMRWQHCQWQQKDWLPTFLMPQQNDPAQQTEANVAASAITNDNLQKNDQLLKQCLKRLLGNQSFSSSKQLLEFTLQTFRRGLASKGALIWVYNKGQLSCRHFYGLEESKQPQAFKLKEVNGDICHRLLQKSAAIRLSAEHKSLSPGLKSLLNPQQQIAIMSVLIGGKPAALLMLIEESTIDDEQFRRFKQLSHGFHQALLRQLQAK